MPTNHTGRFTPRDRAVQMADNAMAEMKGWCDNGLPECYGGKLESALCDWFTDFPWDPGAKASYEHVLENHQACLDLVQVKFGYDLRADFVEVLEDKDGYFAAHETECKKCG